MCEDQNEIIELEPVNHDDNFDQEFEIKMRINESINSNTSLEIIGPDYKYREDEILNEVKKYIDSTYGEHYVHQEANIETGQLILANTERGIGFCTGNMIKYTDRFGKKNGFNRKDILKVIHYAVMLLSINTDVIENN